MDLFNCVVFLAFFPQYTYCPAVLVLQLRSLRNFRFILHFTSQKLTPDVCCFNFVCSSIYSMLLTSNIYCRAVHFQSQISLNLLCPHLCFHPGTCNLGAQILYPFASTEPAHFQNPHCFAFYDAITTSLEPGTSNHTH